MTFRLPRGRRSVFATQLGITPGYLSEILSGRRRPSWDLAVRLSAATGGQLSIEELQPLPDERPYPVAARLRRDDPILSAEDLQRRALELAAEAA